MKQHKNFLKTCLYIYKPSDPLFKYPVFIETQSTDHTHYSEKNCNVKSVRNPITFYVDFKACHCLTIVYLKSFKVYCVYK